MAQAGGREVRTGPLPGGLVRRRHRCSGMPRMPGVMVPLENRILYTQPGRPVSIAAETWGAAGACQAAGQGIPSLASVPRNTLEDRQGPEGGAGDKPYGCA